MKVIILIMILFINLSVNADTYEEGTFETNKKGCDNNNSSACFMLAERYRVGQDVEKDIPKAITLYNKSCDIGKKMECFVVGMMYLEKHPKQGIMKKDKQKAMRYLKKSCDHKMGEACTKISKLYRKGYGVDKDYKKAKKYFQKACKGGDSYGCNSYNNL